VLLSAVAVLFVLLYPSSSSSKDVAADGEQPKQTAAWKRALKLDDRPYELRIRLPDLLLRKPPAEFGSDELRLRDALKELPAGAPEEVSLKAELAALVLESGYGSRQPDTDAVQEGRELADFVFRKAGDKSLVGLRLQMLLLLAEGKAEDALLPASQLQQAMDGRQWADKTEDGWTKVGDPQSDDAEAIWAAYNTYAQALFAATCEKACAARKLELLAKHAVEGAVFKGDPEKQHSSLRAAAMWRIMEAGRVYERAYKVAPTANATWNALDCHFATGRLRNLNAFQVSTTQKLFALGNCEPYEGVRLGGKVCLAADDNPYEMARQRKKKARKRRRTA